MSLSSNNMFHLFNSLPAELRLEIWRQSCSARVVELRYSDAQDQCLSATKPPTILRLCQESRDEGLRIYTLAFGTKTHPAGRIYFCPDLDVLYVPRCGSMGYGDSARDFANYVLETAPLVRYLAVDHVSPEIRRPWETYNKFCLMRNFPKLKEAFLVLAPDARNDGVEDETYGNGQIEFVDPNEDKDAIMRLMEGVRESFSYEVGHTVCLGRDDEYAVVGDQREKSDSQFALIPKRKASHPSIGNASMSIVCS